MTGIQWTDETWGVVLGCERVSPGCDSCYAVRTARLRAGNPHPAIAEAFAGLTEYRDGRLDWTGVVRTMPGRLDQPLHWRKPRRVFVCSQADLFHDDVPDEFIGEVFDRMSAARQHTFQVLTKRHGRMRSLLRRWERCATEGCRCPDDAPKCSMPVDIQYGTWPLPNVWLGVSVEDQKRAELRIPALLDTSAAVRFLSCEPLLGPVDLRLWLDERSASQATAEIAVAHGVGSRRYGARLQAHFEAEAARSRGRIHWVICGGESGPRARPMELAWARTLVEQCRHADVACFVKQLGSRWDADQGRRGKGDDPDLWPADLRVREFPTPTAREAS